LITSGPGRDLKQMHALPLPVFTSGVVCAHGYCHFPSINVPVRVGGVVVKPGDRLHGDCNGVTTIPAEIAPQVARVCVGYMLAEAVLVDYLKSKRVTIKGLAEARAECNEMIEKLGKRLSSKVTTRKHRK
jgi:4-hydroxy-4-methyl-2-oxoglutarate aldolase